MHIPATSAVRASGSTAITPVNPDVSRPLTVFLARARNRFEVGLAEPNRGVFRDGPIAREKPLHARGVSSPCVGRSNRHRYTLVRGRGCPDGV